MRLQCCHDRQLNLDDRRLDDRRLGHRHLEHLRRLLRQLDEGHQSRRYRLDVDLQMKGDLIREHLLLLGGVHLGVDRLRQDHRFEVHPDVERLPHHLGVHRDRLVARTGCFQVVDRPDVVLKRMDCFQVVDRRDEVQDSVGADLLEVRRLETRAPQQIQLRELALFGISVQPVLRAQSHLQGHLR
jgi:hypothetical protein